MERWYCFMLCQTDAQLQKRDMEVKRVMDAIKSKYYTVRHACAAAECVNHFLLCKSNCSALQGVV
eukprot:scaffold307421_cov18-Tisochrysis_lutea.AAC.1